MRAAAEVVNRVIWPCCEHCHHYEPERHHTPCASCDNDRVAEQMGLRTRVGEA